MRQSEIECDLSFITAKLMVGSTDVEAVQCRAKRQIRIEFGHDPEVINTEADDDAFPGCNSVMYHISSGDIAKASMKPIVRYPRLSRDRLAFTHCSWD